ncbi:MAG: AAA family ATPase [Alphaproteobacteria bacterium]|nr:AAA family ATPase [Alphaproteobacteria bacterium]
MYAEHYNLSGRPFQLSPDHRFFYGSRSHNKALAYLSFGLNEREGFIVITGEVGAGKTTLLGRLMSEIDRQQYVSANVVTTQLEGDDALRMVASAFGLQIEGYNKASLLRQIERFFVDQNELGKHVLLVVDEAQNMTPSALEELRMLSNFQSDGKPLLQCFLIGQPQFRAIMAHPAMEQLRQRVIASCHLEPMDLDETRAYILHRLERVGWQNDPSLTDEAFQKIHEHSGGVPRRINTLCGRLLLFGYLEDIHSFDGATVVEVVNELAMEGTQHSANDTPKAMSASVQLPASLMTSDISMGEWPTVQSYNDALSVLDSQVETLKGSS